MTAPIIIPANVVYSPEKHLVCIEVSEATPAALFSSERKDDLSAGGLLFLRRQFGRRSTPKLYVFKDCKFVIINDVKERIVDKTLRFVGCYFAGQYPLKNEFELPPHRPPDDEGLISYVSEFTIN